MELRQLEAFVAVARELHFGRAAARLDIGQPTLSDLVRRLERELGTPLLERTTRRVTLTDAGAVLLEHASTIFAEIAEASTAVRAIGSGDGGTVRLGFTPPVAPVLAPHLCAGFARVAPHVRVHQFQLWLPGLVQALEDGTVDVALTCGHGGPGPPTAVTETVAAEPLLVGLRPDHRLAGRSAVDLRSLAQERLGMAEPSLFPAWAAAQQQALDCAGIAPPVVPLRRADLNAVDWFQQRDVDWVLLIGSLTAGHVDTVIHPVTPAFDVMFVLKWMPSRSPASAVARFVQYALDAPPPAGWHRRAVQERQTGDLRSG